MDYPYENLGPERFQLFCQALLAKDRPNMQCFPVAQPDGGRDAVQFFPDAYPAREFCAFQVKYVRQLTAIADPHKWLIEVAAGELPKIRRQIPAGAKLYVLMTNVRGTAHPDVGSIDTMNRVLSEALGLPAFCWWRDDLNRHLDGS